MIDNIFDSHAHYDDEQFDGDRDELLRSLPSKGICAVINCASDLKSSATSAELSENIRFSGAPAEFTRMRPKKN